VRPVGAQDTQQRIYDPRFKQAQPPANRQPLTDVRPVGAQDTQQRVYGSRFNQAQPPANRQPLIDVPPAVFGQGAPVSVFGPSPLRQAAQASNTLPLYAVVASPFFPRGDLPVTRWVGFDARRSGGQDMPLVLRPPPAPGGGRSQIVFV
jgi:hypothetical protein